MDEIIFENVNILFFMLFHTYIILCLSFSIASARVASFHTLNAIITQLNRTLYILNF